MGGSFKGNRDIVQLSPEEAQHIVSSKNCELEVCDGPLNCLLW
jgi:hypothetical protein